MTASNTKTHGRSERSRATQQPPTASALLPRTLAHVSAALLLISTLLGPEETAEDGPGACSLGPSAGHVDKASGFRLAQACPLCHLGNEPAHAQSLPVALLKIFLKL